MNAEAGVTGEVVLEERLGKVLLLKMNRPDACNAMNQAMYGALVRRLRDAERDASVNCVVLTGIGKYFSAGVDLKQRNAEKITSHEYFETALFSDDRPGHFYGFVSRYRKPIITAINGPAIGGGAITGLLGDISVMADDGYLSLPEIERGVTADGATLVLPRLTSRAQAMYLVLTGRRISAEKAERIGLVSLVTPAAETLSTALELAEEVSQRSGIAIRLFKTATQAGPWGDSAVADALREAMRSLAETTPERYANTAAAVKTISSK